MDKGLSLNEIRTRAAQFVIAWRDAKGDEKQEDQSFIRELLNVFGVSESRAALYQKRVQRSSTGNQGYIDALIPGLVLIEMKSVGKNLGLAEIQALDYIQHLEEAEVPRYVLSSDFKRFRLLDLHGGKGTDTAEFSLEELPKNIETLGFLAGYQTRLFGNRQQEEASIKAAKIMGDLYEALEGSGYGDHEVSIFLVRTLFALYADDAGVWRKDLFTEFLNSRTTVDGSDLGPQLTMLYQVMNQPLDSRSGALDELIARFPYVNGGIFSESLPIPVFSKRMRDQLLEACAFNWSSISPAIFGSLFQAVKSPAARRELGEHYTSEQNILKTIEPLFLDELRAKFKTVQNDIDGLRKLRSKLNSLRIFDPACGCGNFLVVAYRELRGVELAVISRLQELGDRETIPTLYFERSDLAVRLDHVFGIEIEEWPARIAQTALILADHQANRELELALGKSPNVLPLETVNGIHVANALRTDWEQVVSSGPEVFIVGNPPFVGHQTKTPDQVADLKLVWGKEYAGYLDYVTGWFKKAIDYFDGTKGGRFAFVATNSISQGVAVEPLFNPIFEKGWRIRFAHQTFPWESESPGAAAVHCVIVGFDMSTAPAPALYSYASHRSAPISSDVGQINGYLSDGPNVFVKKRSKPLSAQLPEVSFGTMPIDGGNLIVENSDIGAFRADPVANKYLRKFVGSKELVQGLDRWCLWLENLESPDLVKSSLLRERIEACRLFREDQPRGGDAYKYRTTPHLFRPNGKRPKASYLALPRVVSEHRPFFTVDRLDGEVIASDAVFTAQDVDGFAFAVASSSIFLVWQKSVGGRLKSDLRFSSTVVWNNLPLPHVPKDRYQQIVEAGKTVLDVRRETPHKSLAELYDPLAISPGLLRAHRKLDRAVDRAFGVSESLASDEERQRVLFESFLQLTGVED